MGYPNGNIFTVYHFVFLFLVSLLVLSFPRVEGQIRRSLQNVDGPHAEVAMVGTLPSPGTRYYGGKASLSVWNPFVSRVKDASLSSMVVKLTDNAFLEAGWIVYPERYGDFETRLFVYWTTDDFESTGCFDLDCEGFVLSNKSSNPLGGPILPISTIGAATYNFISVVIFEVDGNWALGVGGTLVGYWPASLFAGLPSGAEQISWGGTVFDSIGNGTLTDMGNGLLPDVGPNRASDVCSLKVIDGPNGTLSTADPNILGYKVTSPLCYDATILPIDVTKGLCFLYGGSGAGCS